ncbi:putative acetyltransferase [Winogradskyella epiphytica]|uniref:Putative acetyltransferase n=1 Tax=Winogradskyella epiphytica TaxID=262005 RepID=A0A2V4XQM1_9FLAO|nr:GNAT family N-acetyltransferase [Winogradskyella epiphytica]PYE80127.1 putative acetyltransferase [Winogradskyella epiphytica]GGW71597.1 acetyltransferase [Winogradskyella epiphytica]
MKHPIEIRQATLDDIPEITAIFRNTITHINAKDYNEKQISVWSYGADDIEEWKKRIKNYYFIVAEMNTNIVGFAYLKNGNYFDGIYVHKDHLRQGIGSKLLRIIESQVMMNDYEVMKSDVSKTALPFFDNRYFEVIKKQKKSFKGVVFENYLMEKNLND